ncbi:MAG: hypothetical protein M1840_003625 [Geoglossum simile]|nr:MAG: hypothetical protein M1840_003625 [Geoglossum simile]
MLNGPLNNFIRNYDSCGYPAADFTKYLEIDKWYSTNSRGTIFGAGYDEGKAQDLLSILSEFERLRGVNWTLGGKIDPEFAQRVMDVFAGSETVKEFCIKFDTAPPQFDALDNLQKLIVQSKTGLKETMDAFSQIQTVIRRSPNLRYLGLDLKRSRECQYLAQRQLNPFRFTPERGCLPLEHLMLKGGWELRLDSSLWRNLRNLKTLEISDKHSLPNPLDDEYPSNWGQFWKGMEDNKIHLRKISVPELSVALLEYMASYRGIEELIVERPVWNEDESNIAGHMFFTSFLPRHAGSLRVLQLKKHFEPAWRFGPKAVEMLRKNRRLEKLSVAIVENDKMTITRYLRLLSGIKTLKHLEIPTLVPRAYFYRTERSPTTPVDWATKHGSDLELKPLAPHPEFITIGEVQLRYQKEPATAAHYQPIEWMSQEEGRHLIVL